MYCPKMEEDEEVESECSCLRRAIRNRYFRENLGCYAKATKSYNDLQEQYEAKKRYEQSRLPQNENSSGYLQRVIFPHLKPAMEQMIYHAIRKNGIEDQKQAFNGVDYLAEVLWNTNSKYPDRRANWKSAYFIFRSKGCICDRPMYPLHWVLPKEVAAIWIQKAYRGYWVRKRHAVQEMRKFWKNIKEENWKFKRLPEEEIRVPKRIAPDFKFL